MLRRLLPNHRFAPLCFHAGSRRWAASSLPSPGAPQNQPPPSNVVAALEHDPQLLEAVVEQLSPEARRRLVVAGGACEWFGKDSVADEVKAADLDADQTICPKDFDRWFEGAMKRRLGRAEEGAAATEGATAAVPLGALLLIALEAGLPFVGFGFLDNATMILAGDAIDKSLGMYLHCSVMASAAMGNVVSGCMGMQVHGGVEKVVQRLNLPVPALSDAQRRSHRVFLAGHIGGTVGIACGLLLGMLPLLFIGDDEDKAEGRVFGALDADGDGFVSAQEVQAALKEAGLTVEAAQVQAVIDRHGGGPEGLSRSAFHSVVTELREAS